MTESEPLAPSAIVLPVTPQMGDAVPPKEMTKEEIGEVIQAFAKAAKILEAEGIELLSLTGGMCRFIRKDHNEPGYFGDMSAAIREKIAVPILLTGGVKTLEQAQQLLDEEMADFIGVGRPLLAAADWMMEAEKE